MISLFVFLGNPGAQYECNRHNAGVMLADFLAESLSGALSFSLKKQFKGEFAQYSLNGGNAEKNVFLKPATFMNLSGESVIEVMNFYKVKAEQALVIHDELELPFGVISLKFAGGLGGHNGLRSIEKMTGTRDFWRLRIGIGRPNHDDIASYVLSDFSKSEKPDLPFVFSEACTLINF